MSDPERNCMVIKETVTHLKIVAAMDKAEPANHPDKGQESVGNGQKTATNHVTQEHSKVKVGGNNNHLGISTAFVTAVPGKDVNQKFDDVSTSDTSAGNTVGMW